MSVTSINRLVPCLMLVAFPVLVNTDVLLHSDVGVLAFGEASVEEHPREKREVNKAMVGFNKEEKEAILERHNHLRTLPKAKTMLKMVWDLELEKLAQNYADKCIFEHNKDRRHKAFTSVGENLYAGTGNFDPASVVQVWYDEVKDYDYATNKCKQDKMCGHYTQVVWVNSSAVGCGGRYCEHLGEVAAYGFSSGFVVVCNYGPSGNYIGRKPYEIGQPCSLCPEGRKYCAKGLCGTSP